MVIANVLLIQYRLVAIKSNIDFPPPIIHHSSFVLQHFFIIRYYRIARMFVYIDNVSVKTVIKLWTFVSFQQLILKAYNFEFGVANFTTETYNA